jgi:hypothetical protein
VGWGTFHRVAYPKDYLHLSSSSKFFSQEMEVITAVFTDHPQGRVIAARRPVE